MKLLLLVFLPFLAITACGSSESERFGESLDPPEVEEVVKACVDEVVSTSEVVFPESEVTLICEQISECILDIVSDKISPIFDCMREAYAYAVNLEVFQNFDEFESSEELLDDSDIEAAVEICVDEATSSSDSVITRSEATLFCEQVFDCILAEDRDLANLEVSTMFDCLEEHAEDLVEQVQQRN